MNQGTITLIIFIELAATLLAFLGTWLTTGNALAIGEALPLWIGVYLASGIGVAYVLIQEAMTKK
jgi:hypothetical protein